MATAFVIVDPQNDFGTKKSKITDDNGALYVTNGEKIIPVIFKMLAVTKYEGGVYVTLDSHPNNHCSFVTSNSGATLFQEWRLPNGELQMMWPVHCIPGTWGHEVMEDLYLPKDVSYVIKGTNKEVDSYSGFGSEDGKSEITELHDRLQGNNVKNLVVCGLALDYCVKFTILDALKRGYTVTLIVDGTYAVESDKSTSVLTELKTIGGDNFTSMTSEEYIKEILSK